MPCVKSVPAAVIGAAMLTALCQGCNTSGCTDNRNSVPLAGFYDRAGQSIVPDSLAVAGVGAPNDSLLCAPGSGRQSVYLPFRSATEVTSFAFSYRSHQLAALGIADTVTFTYSSEPYFVSEDCGAMYRYRITGVEHTSWLIDSVGVTDSLITNLDIEQIKIFFITDDGQPEEPGQ